MMVLPAQLFSQALRAAPEGTDDELRALLWRDLMLQPFGRTH